MLVINDSWGSGWKAYVDDVEQPVLRANYAFRGVVLSEGEHRVVLRYRPSALLISLVISGGTFLFLMILGAYAAIRAMRQLN